MSYKVYTIKNVKTGKLFDDPSKFVHKFYKNFDSTKNELDKYKETFELRVKGSTKRGKQFLLNNLPEDLRIVSYNLVDEEIIL